MSEHVVARTDELRPGERKVVKLGRLQIGLFRIGDEFYALPNICPHQFGPLCQGKLGGAIIATADTDWRPEWFYDGEVVTCPWHGLEFQVPTGRCLAFPKVRLRRYPVKIEGDDVKLVL